VTATPLAPVRGRLGALVTFDAAIALGIALYLGWSKLAHAPTVCGPLGGCSTVANSSWSEVAGVPVALFGAAASAVVLAGALAWWRRADRRGLWVVYLVGLASLPVLAFLTWLELFEIRAICDWCVAYAVTVIAGWVLAASVLWRERA
jgi:uncharacterized membrane protein